MNNMEELFLTRDLDADGDPIVFNLIEDEYGDTWWAYGHAEPEALIAELNRWLDHAMGEAQPGFELGTQVDHLWAQMIDEERFRLVDPSGPEGDAGFFPVTRVMI